LRFIRARHRALIPNIKTKALSVVLSTGRAQPVGRNLTDCISLQIQSHVTFLAEESRAKNDDVFMLRRRK